jgi:ribosomal protein L32
LPFLGGILLHLINASDPSLPTYLRETMAYETCPECGAQKHQLVACPQCGFKRMTVRPTIDRELFDDEEFPRSRSTTATPVSSNFEACPTCGTRKHLLMACPSCGFSRSGNPERLANKPPYEPKPRHETNSRYTPRSHHETNPHYAGNSRYEDRPRDYYGPSTVEQERLPSQNTPIVRWKRSSKTNGNGNTEPG